MLNTYQLAIATRAYHTCFQYNFHMIYFWTLLLLCILMENRVECWTIERAIIIKITHVYTYINEFSFWRCLALEKCIDFQPWKLHTISYWNWQIFEKLCLYFILNSILYLKVQILICNVHSLRFPLPVKILFTSNLFIRTSFQCATNLQI